MIVYLHLFLNNTQPNRQCLAILHLITTSCNDDPFITLRMHWLKYFTFNLALSMLQSLGNIPK